MSDKPGNGSDSESLEYTFKYNPPMDHGVAERVLKEAKISLMTPGSSFFCGQELVLERFGMGQSFHGMMMSTFFPLWELMD